MLRGYSHLVLFIFLRSSKSGTGTIISTRVRFPIHFFYIFYNRWYDWCHPDHSLRDSNWFSNQHLHSPSSRLRDPGFLRISFRQNVSNPRCNIERATLSTGIKLRARKYPWDRRLLISSRRYCFKGLLCSSFCNQAERPARCKALKA